MQSSEGNAARTIRGGRESDRDAILSLLQTAWPEMETTWYLNDPWFEWEQFRLAEVDGRVVSSIMIHRREIVWGGNTALMGGIAGVVTHPDFRRQGHAGALLEDAARYMSTNGYELGMLFTGIHAFYRQHGWRAVPFLLFKAQLEAVPEASHTDYTFRRFDPGRDMESVASLYAAFNRIRTGTLVRTLTYWRNHLTWSSEDMPAFTVALQNDRVVGYVRGVRWKECFCIQECVYDQDHAASVDGLAACAIERARDLGCPEVWAIVPRDNAVVAALRKCGLNVREDEWLSMMLRPIDRRSLALKLGRTGFTSDNEFYASLSDFFFWRTDGF